MDLELETQIYPFLEFVYLIYSCYCYRDTKIAAATALHCIYSAALPHRNVIHRLTGIADGRAILDHSTHLPADAELLATATVHLSGLVVKVP